MKPFILIVLLSFAATAENGSNVNNSHSKDSLTNSALKLTPYEITKGKDIMILCAGVALAGVGFALERSEKPLTQQQINALDRNSVNGFDRSATYRYSKTIGTVSDVCAGLAVAAPLGLLADAGIRKTITTFSLMYAEVEIYSYVLPCLGKGLFKRARPFNYNPAVPLSVKQGDDSRASFFSRHTTMAFASACFISTMYGTYHPESVLRPYVWAGSLAAASSVGYMRYRAGAHFPTDILTGVLAGALVGCGVPFLHKSKNTPVHAYVDPFNNALCLSVDW
jgi:membrane-associated phospholipid phosphatase